MNTDSAELDRRQREAWRNAAQGWERWQESLREHTEPVMRWLVEALDPQPGQRLLEIAAGPGETGFLAAQRVGPSGSLLSTDQSPEMLEVARRRAAALGLDNVEFAQQDAQQLDFDPASFDGAVCRWGYMLMADPDEALRRTRRALRDGGRLAMATWDAPETNLWMVAPMIQLVSRGILPPPDPSQPSPFAMPDPAALQQRLLEAGFSSAHAEKLPFEQRYPSFEQYWAETLDLAAPIAVAMAQLDPVQIDEVREGSREALRRFTAPDGTMVVPASAVVALATA